MYIDLDKINDRIIITFDYDARVVDAVKSLPGRRFDAEFKRWTVPSSHAHRVLALLTPMGFGCHSAVNDLAKHAKNILDEKEIIRATPDLCQSKLPLYDFQKIGAAFLEASDGALLGDVPGLGKSLQTIAALEDERYRNILIFCPASLKYSWSQEIQKWRQSGEVNINVVDGTPKERARTWTFPLSATCQTFTIANYELLLRDILLMKKISWDAIVCDESTRISNAGAKTTKLLKSIPCRKRLALTGTPVSNSPDDIYSIIDWISPGYLGHWPQFRERYCILDFWKNVVGYKNLSELADLIKPLMLRRTKEEVLKELPKKTSQDIIFSLSEEEQKVYDGVKEYILKEIGGYLGKIDKKTLALIPVKLLRLQQATDHLRLLGEQGESTKLKVLQDLVDPIIKSGDKVIVFTKFAEMSKLLLTAFPSGGIISLINGEVPVSSRQEIVNSFNSDPSCKILVMTEAGAYGLNLQGANYIIHYDLPWSIAKLEQREGRAHRIGQTKPVTIYNLIAKNTIDEYVMKKVRRKARMSNDILSDSDRMKESGLSEEDVRSILRI